MSTNPSDYIGVAYSALTADGLNYGTISTMGATTLKNLNIESPYPTACLTAVSILNTVIGTAATTLKTEVKKLELGISYNISNRELVNVGDKFRLRAQSDSATTISLQTKTLDSTARQPSLKLSISEVK